MQGVQLFCNDDYCAELFLSSKESRRIVITFTEVGYGTVKGLGFGTKFLFEAGFDVIAIKSKYNNWYVDFGDHLVDQVNRYIRDRGYSESITYGSSMGGYAAFFFAGKIHANRAFAISPQFDITLDVDKRWRNHVRPEFEMRKLASDNVISRCEYILIYDPLDLDHIHVDAFRAVIPPDQLKELALPNSGHPSGGALAEAGQMSSVALSILNGRYSDLNQAEIARSLRRTSHYYFQLSDKFIRGKRLRAALASIEHALKQKPFHPDYNMRAGQIYARMNQYENTLKFVSTAAALQPTNPFICAYLAETLNKIGRNKAAVHYYEQAISIKNNEEWRNALASLVNDL